MFRAGDTVQVKSGGPIMTVSDAHGISGIDCTWNDRGEVKRGSFAAEVLKAVEMPKPVRVSVPKRNRRRG